ncbi:hypothetical protein Defa_27770 [Desulfovibrio sp. TH_2024_36128]|uniref:Uncharacterized protein n=1 Tax=Desulfovibrio falkowii TaxID=3136602 RepID=A0ABQ0EBV9_9BACT
MLRAILCRAQQKAVRPQRFYGSGQCRVNRVVPGPLQKTLPALLTARALCATLAA